MLRKLNPINAYRETKSVFDSVREFGVPEYRTALRAAAALEKKMENIIAKTEQREKELEQQREEFQARLQVELQRLQVVTDGMVRRQCIIMGNAYSS